MVSPLLPYHQQEAYSYLLPQHKPHINPENPPKTTTTKQHTTPSPIPVNLPQTPANKTPSAIQVRYAATEIESSKSARARGAYLRVSFKNTRETAQAINGWKLQRALTYLDNVIEKKEVVPMRRYAGGTGRASQGMFDYSVHTGMNMMRKWVELGYLDRLDIML